VLKGYRDWLVYESKNYQEREFINASESGILNETFKLKKISEIYEKYKNNFVNVDDVLKDNYYPISISNFQLINLFADLSNEFSKLKENTIVILELLNESSGLTQSLSIELNNYFSFYNSLRIKNFIDYNIQNYLLNFNINDLELCKKLLEQIKTESENFIQILKQIT
ncbi:MAG TPA: hypothetical protein PK189_08160, partial [bacterium]|nr:hypothetical protein [bacterium]